MNLNKVFILGRVTADLALKSTNSGMQVANFSIATNRVWNDKAGNRKEETEFHNVVVWGRQAEVAARFLKKGSLVLVEGRLQTRSWDDKNGQKRKTTEIVCERLQLGPKPMGGAQAVFSEGEPATDLSADSAAETSLRGAKEAVSARAETIAGREKEIPTIEIGEDLEDVKEEDLPF